MDGRSTFDHSHDRQPADQCGTGADLAAGHDSINGAAPFRGGRGGPAADALDGASPLGFHAAGVFRFPPISPLKAANRFGWQMNSMETVRLEPFVVAVVFVGARVAGLMVFCPFLGSNAIPVRLKAALAVVITAVLYPLHSPIQLDLHSWQWAGVVLSEVVIGLVLGLAANFMMEAPMMAGQILGVQMG